MSRALVIVGQTGVTTTCAGGIAEEKERDILYPFKEYKRDVSLKGILYRQ